VDPAVEQTQQAYLYVGDDPVNGTDPSGDIFVGALGQGNGFDCPAEPGLPICYATYSAGGWSWLGGVLRHAEQATRDLEHFTMKHRALIETIATTAIAVAAAGTGVGALVDLGMGFSEAAEAWFAASTVLSVVGGVANGAECKFAHDQGACVGMVFDLGSGVLGGVGTFVEKAGAQVLGQLLKAKGFSIGLGGLVWDASTGRW
jgi:hypothetical protein